MPLAVSPEGPGEGGGKAERQNAAMSAAAGHVSLAGPQQSTQAMFLPTDVLCWFCSSAVTVLHAHASSCPHGSIIGGIHSYSRGIGPSPMLFLSTKLVLVSYSL